tara:strand:+ start:1753 stop:2232 length:480 start_codon:yes stop_codon:yes gene_type:complete
MNKFLNNKNFYLAIALFSIFTLLSAVYVEYVLGAKPCKLCIYQRIPYIVAIFLCFFGYSNLKKNVWIYLVSLTFLISFLISVYHTGIENNIFDEFSGCTSNNLNITNKDDLLQSLSESTPNCKDVTFRIFGLSLATINMFISMLIIIISIMVIKNEKNR